MHMIMKLCTAASLKIGTRSLLLRNSDREGKLLPVRAFMAVDAKAVFHEDFPDPREQAEALLEICQGDVLEAQAIAGTNVRFSRCQDDQTYWSRVESLILQHEPAAVVERLEENKLKSRAAIKQQVTNY